MLTALLAARLALRLRARGAAAVARPRSLPARGDRRADRRRRLLRRDLSRRRWIDRAVPRRHGPDRLRRRPVRGRHADRRHGDRRQAADAASRSAPGARVQATAAGLAIAFGGALRDIVSSLAAHGALGPALTSPAHRLQRRLPHRNRAAVRDAGRDRPARSGCRTSRRYQSQSKFGLAEFPDLT